MLDNKNNKYYGVDSGCGSPQNWGNLQSAYSLRSHQSWWTSKGVKGAVLGLGLATLLPITNAFAADPVDVEISWPLSGQTISLTYGTELTDENAQINTAKVYKKGTQTEVTDQGTLKLVSTKTQYNAGSYTQEVGVAFIPKKPNELKPGETPKADKANLSVGKANPTEVGDPVLSWLPAEKKVTYANKTPGGYGVETVVAPCDIWDGHALQGTFTYSYDRNNWKPGVGDYYLTWTWRPVDGNGNPTADAKNYNQASVTMHLIVEQVDPSETGDYTMSTDWGNIPYGTWIDQAYMAGKAGGKNADLHKLDKGAHYQIIIPDDAGGYQSASDKAITGKTAENCYDVTENLPNLSMGSHKKVKIKWWNDNNNYKSVTTEVKFTVVKAEPTIVWPSRNPTKGSRDQGTLGDIEEGKPLYSENKLNAYVLDDPVNGWSLYPMDQRDEPGETNPTYSSLTYLLNGREIDGNTTLTAQDNPYQITVLFEMGKRSKERDYYYNNPPADSYLKADLQVFKKKQTTITWNPVTTTLDFGTALTKDNVMNAVGSVPGTTTYIPPVGKVLNVGKDQQVQVTFIPDDRRYYAESSAEQLVTVVPVLPDITWNLSFRYGTVLPSDVAGLRSFLKSRPSVEERFKILYAGEPTNLLDIPDIDKDPVTGVDRPCEYYYIDEFDYSDGKTLAQHIKELVDKINRTGVAAEKTVFIVAADFSSIEQYMGKEIPAGSYPIPVHFMPVGVNASKFLNTLTPEEDPYPVVMNVWRKAPLIGYEEGKLWSSQWDKDNPAEFIYGEPIKDVLENAWYVQDTEGNWHDLHPKDDGKGHDLTDDFGTISYQIWSGATTISPGNEKIEGGTRVYANDLNAEQEILNDKRGLDVRRLFYTDGDKKGQPTDDSDYMLVVVFTPNRDKYPDYRTSYAAVPVIVYKSDVDVSWVPEDSIPYGVRISGDQLNAVVTATYLGKTITFTQNYNYQYKVDGADDKTYRTLEDMMPLDANTYTMRLSFTPKAADGAYNYEKNYNTATETRQLGVYKATLTMQAENKNVSVGSNPPVYTYKPYGLQYTDTLPAIFNDASKVLSCSYTKNSAKGSYAINWTTDAINALKPKQNQSGWDRGGNYNVEWENGTLFAGMNPRIVWGPLDDAVIGDSYDSSLTAIAYDPTTGNQLSGGSFVYYYGKDRIEGTTTIAEPGNHRLTAEYTDASGEYLPSTSYTDLWVKDKPYFPNDAWNQDKKVYYGDRVTNDQIKSFVKKVLNHGKANIRSQGDIVDIKWADAKNPSNDNVNAGTYKVSFKFKPSDGHTYVNSDTYTATVTVSPIDMYNEQYWSWNPEGLTYGSKLSNEKQLNAVVTGPALVMKDGNPNGKIEYTYRNMPPAGKEKLQAKFIPNPDIAMNFTQSQPIERTITVAKATLHLDWTLPNKGEITYGDPVDSSYYSVKAYSDNKDYTAEVEGTHKDTPKPTAYPNVGPNGQQTLTVEFTPSSDADKANFVYPATETRTLKVKKADLSVTYSWKYAPQDDPNGRIAHWQDSYYYYPDYFEYQYGTYFDSDACITMTGTNDKGEAATIKGKKNYTVWMWTFDEEAQKGSYVLLEGVDPSTTYLHVNTDWNEYGWSYAKEKDAKGNEKLLPPYKVKLTFTAASETDKQNYNAVEKFFGIFVDSTSRVALAYDYPIEITWDKDGICFTDYVGIVSAVSGEEGTPLEWGEAYFDLQNRRTYDWYYAYNDNLYTDIPSGKYYLYADMAALDPDYAWAYEGQIDLYIDPAVYIKTDWDSEGEGYSPDPDPYDYPPYLGLLMDPLVFEYPYSETADHQFNVATLAAKAIDAETYAYDATESEVETSAYASDVEVVDKARKFAVTWSDGDFYALYPNGVISNLLPGEHVLTLECTAVWDNYRHYFMGKWTKDIIFRVTQETPKATWTPADIYFAEEPYRKEPGDAQRKAWANIPGVFYFPGDDMSKSGIPEDLWPTPEWPTEVVRDSSGKPAKQLLWATFKPEDDVTYETILVPGYLTVRPDEVKTSWAPAPMEYGDTTPGPQQLNAKAQSVHNGIRLDNEYGTFSYPLDNWPTEAGQHTVVAIFNPKNPNNYADYKDNPGYVPGVEHPIRATAVLTISPKPAPIDWDPTPLTLAYDKPFMYSQLGEHFNSHGVPGYTEYYCGNTEVLVNETPEELGIPVGSYKLKAVFYPTDGNYTKNSKEVDFEVTNSGISIVWEPKKTTIGYTTQLDTENYLNAKAYRNGKEIEDAPFVYDPEAGVSPKADGVVINPEGDTEWELTATLTLEGEDPIEVSETILVEPAKLVADFTSSEIEIFYGERVNNDNATVVVTDPATGDEFEDGEVTSYTVAVVEVSSEALDPDWIMDDNNVLYKPNEDEESEEEYVTVDPSEDLLPHGTYLLTARFTPDEDEQEAYGEYVDTDVPATLTVKQTTPKFEVTNPISLPYDVLFDNAMGKFWFYEAGNEYDADLEVADTGIDATFVDENGDVVTETEENPLPVGSYTATLILNPVDTYNYTTATNIVDLNVGKATPVINWYPDPIIFTYGDLLPEGVFTAVALNRDLTTEIDGEFVYYLNGKEVKMGAPLVNMLGVQELTAVFNPDNTKSYTSPKETVELTVNPGSRTPVAIQADPKTITFGDEPELTYTVVPSGAAEAELTTTYYTDPRVGVHEITFVPGSVMPTDEKYAIANPIPSTLIVNPATPTVEFYELLTEENDDGTETQTLGEEPLKTIALVYGDVMTFDTNTAIITITNIFDTDSDVESASDVTLTADADADDDDEGDDADDDDEPVVVRTIKVVAKDINGKEMGLESINFSLDAEQPLEPQDEAYTLTVALTYGNGNYADGSVTIPVTVATDEDALDVEWVVEHTYNWSEGKTWKAYGVEKDAVATFYSVPVAEKEDEGFSYWMAKLPDDVVIPEGVDPEDLNLEDFGLTVGDLDLVEFKPEAIVAEAGVYYLLAVYANELYGVDADEDIVLFVAPIPVVEVKVETITYEGMVAGDDVRKFVNYTVTSIAPVDGTLECYEVEGIDNDYIGKIYPNENEQTLPAGKYKVTAEFTLTPVVGVKYDVTTVSAELDVAEYVPPIPVVNVTVTTIAKEGMITGEPASKYLDAVVDPEVDGDIYYHVTGNNIDLVVDIDDAVTTLPVGNYDVTAVFTPAPVVGVDYVITETSDTLTVADVPLIPVKLTAGVIQNPIVYGQKYVGDIYFTAVDVNGAGVAGKASWTVIDKKTGEVVSTFNPPALPDVEILNAGDYTLTVDFTPDSSAYAKPADASVDLTVEQAFVDVAAHTAQGMVAGDNVSNYILPYTTTPEGVTGQPVYGVYDENEELVIEVDPEEDKYQTLPAGIYTVEPMIFVPDSDNYRFGQPESDTLIVEAVPTVVTIEWNVPETIVFGTAIEGDAVVSVDGVPQKDLSEYVVYYLDNEDTPLGKGWILPVDTYQVKAVFIAPLGADYSGAETAWMPVTVTPKKLTVTLDPDPAEVVYGEILVTPVVKIEGLLEGDMVDYDVDDSFYKAGETPAGTYKDAIIATRIDDDSNYEAPEQLTGTLTVLKAKQDVTLVVNPTVLNVGDSATATVVTTSGLTEFTLVISDPSILSPNLVALKVGTVTVKAKQAGDNNYEPAESMNTVEVTVAPKADVQITWEPKSPITYGTILSAEHLNATAELDGLKVEGHFYYNPTFGYVVTPESPFVVNGKLRLSATFIPTDRKRYKNAYVEVLVDIVVEEDDTTDDGEDAPTLTISKAGSVKGMVNAAADALVITFTGTLEESTDGVTWTPVADAKDGTYVVDVKVASKKFYRSAK